MVAPPCLALLSAARWNGQPAHAQTGVARASATHSQPSNPSGGTIAISARGTVSAAATVRRSPRRVASCASLRVSDAWYPAPSTARTRSSTATAPSS